MTQGEQVAMLWPLIFEEKNTVHFAHTSFLWSNLASKKATVTCVILGLTAKQQSAKKIFDADTVRIVPNISPYLVATENLIVPKRSTPVAALPPMQSGNKPSDGGHLMLSDEEKKAFLSKCPSASKFIKRYSGSHEIINGGSRWCVWVEDNDIKEAQAIPELSRRFTLVAEKRASGGKQAADNASTPHRFVFAPHNSRPAIAVPNVSSERREYPRDLPFRS